MSIKIVSNEKYDGEGRAFGSANNPIKRSLVLISTETTLPTSYSDVDGLGQCAFAPGSILISTSQNKDYIYNGTAWVVYKDRS